MASPQSFTKYTTKEYITADLSGDVTTAAAVSWYALKDYGGLLAEAALVVLDGNGIEGFSIYAATSSAGANAAAMVTHSDPTTADAAGDILFLECSAEQIAQEGSDAGVSYTHVAIYLECHSASDQVLAQISFKDARYPRDGLTADIIA